MCVCVCGGGGGGGGRKGTYTYNTLNRRYLENGIMTFDW